MAISAESLGIPRIEEVAKPIERRDFSRPMDLSGQFLLNAGKWLILSEILLALNSDLPNTPLNTTPLAIAVFGVCLRIAARLPGSEAPDNGSQMDW